MRVLNWNPGVDSSFDPFDGTVMNEEADEGVQECPRCGAKLLIRRNEVVDVFEEGFK